MMLCSKPEVSEAHHTCYIYATLNHFSCTL